MSQSSGLSASELLAIKLEEMETNVTSELGSQLNKSGDQEVNNNVVNIEEENVTKVRSTNTQLTISIRIIFIIG